jgi:superfamily I DNA/RNA helicase/RecB family exonuclease
VLTLRRAPGLVSDPPPLDEGQQAAVDHRGGVLRVLGGPGTGKSTTAVEVVLARVESGEAAPDQCLILTSSRLAAARLRECVTARLARTSTEALARSHQSFGFGLLRQAAALRGDPAPRLLSGPEQDAILRDLLAGHASGQGQAPQWPERVRAALPTRGFRAELRDLLMRAVEHHLEPADLEGLGVRHGRPEWVAAAQVLREYDEVTALSAPGAYDPAWILGAAADHLLDDPEAHERLLSGLRLVVVDDAQELTPAAARLLEVVHTPSLDVVLVGDPDAAVQTFRGADPRYLAHGWTALGDGRTIALPTAYRLPRRLTEVAARVTGHIGVLGELTHRTAAPVRVGGRVDVQLARAVSQEAALVAGALREAHLIEGVPWSQMAVVVRGQGRTSTLRRVLGGSGVPVSASTADVPVRDEPAVRPLLALLQAVIELALGHRDALDPETAAEVLLSPLGGADAVSLRRLRRALRQEELAGGGGRPSDVLLAEALVNPQFLATLGPVAAPARRVASVVAAGVAAARTVAEEGHRRWAPGVTAEQVLWAMWDASRLAGPWRRTALAGGPAGARADRDLDAVVALFGAAARHADRLPHQGPDGFLEHVRGQDLPEDTLVARAPAGEAVSVLTPQAAAGRQWRFVVVAGVQEGVWPDLRLRGSLLGSQELDDVVTGRGGSLRAAQAAVRHDETRLFLVAVTRASERLLVTAVRSDDEQPSPFLDVVDPLPTGKEGGRPFATASVPLTLPGLVAALRRDLLASDARVRGGAVTSLARLAREGVPGAAPWQWWSMTTPSDDRPLRPEGAPVRVSPSRIEAFGNCQLRWLLSACGGDGPSLGAADIGSLVHDVAAEVGDADAQTLREAVDQRWGRLGLAPGWVTERKRAEAHRMVERLARYFSEAAAQGWVKVGAEVDMEVALGRAVLRGRVDRLEANGDGALRVIDYKTGGRSSRPRADALARLPQLGAYQVAVVHGAFGQERTSSAGAALLQIGKGAGAATTLDVQPALADDPAPLWAEELVAATAESMASSTFTATVGDWCRVCAVKTACPAQPEGKVI